MIQDFLKEIPSPRRLRAGILNSMREEIPPIKLEGNVRSSRSKAIGDITSEKQLGIEKAEEEIIQSRNSSSIIGNMMSEAALLLEILKPGMVITDETQFNF